MQLEETLNQQLNNNSTEILGRWQSSDTGDGVTPRLWSNRDNFINLLVKRALDL
jgi:hypothetical protein